MRLLIVEDEKELCDAVAQSLFEAGYEVDTCYDGMKRWIIFCQRIMI